MLNAQKYANLGRKEMKHSKLNLAKISLILIVLVLSLQAISLVKAGVPITIEHQHDTVPPSETPWFNFKLEEVEASDKTIEMWVEGLPADWTYDFSPAITDIASLGTATTRLNIHVPATVGSGNFEFTVYVKANDVIIPILEQITTYTTQLFVVPEYPLGTAMGLTSMIAAFSVFCVSRSGKKKRKAE